MALPIEQFSPTPEVTQDPVRIQAGIDAVLDEIDVALLELGESQVVSESGAESVELTDAVRTALGLVDAAVAETDDEAPSPSYIAYCLRTMRALLVNAEY